MAGAAVEAKLVSRPCRRTHPMPHLSRLRRRFLNRLLALPVGRQNLLFNYFSVSVEGAACLPACGQHGQADEARAKPEPCIALHSSGSAASSPSCCDLPSSPRAGHTRWYWGGGRLPRPTPGSLEPIPPRSYLVLSFPLVPLQAALQAEIQAAKAEGKYFEGVSDLPGQDIARDGEPQVRPCMCLLSQRWCAWPRGLSAFGSLGSQRAQVGTSCRALQGCADHTRVEPPPSPFHFRHRCCALIPCRSCGLTP